MTGLAKKQTYHAAKPKKQRYWTRQRTVAAVVAGVMALVMLLSLLPMTLMAF